MKYIHRTGATYISTSEPYYLDGMRGSDNIIHDMPEWKTDDSDDQIIGGKIHIYAACMPMNNDRAVNLFGSILHYGGSRNLIKTSSNPDPIPEKYQNLACTTSAMVLEMNNGVVRSFGHKIGKNKIYEVGTVSFIEDPQTHTEHIDFKFGSEFFTTEELSNLSQTGVPSCIAPFFNEEQNDFTFEDFLNLKTMDYVSPTDLHKRTIEQIFSYEYETHPEAYEIELHIPPRPLEATENTSLYMTVSYSLPTEPKAVQFTVGIENIGNVPVSNIRLQSCDYLQGYQDLEMVDLTLPDNIDELMPGERMEFVTTYNVTQQDVQDRKSLGARVEGLVYSLIRRSDLDLTPVQEIVYCG